MIQFHLDRRSGVASYLQLVHQVKQALRLGLLAPGDKLPTAKEVVVQLGINPNTVLKSYRELEREGLALGRPGLGTFIQSTLGEAAAAGHEPLRRQLLDWCRAAQAAGLARADVEALFAAALTDLFDQENRR